MVLTDYIDAALGQAEHEQMSDGVWYAHIPEFSGLWATGQTVESCRDDLRSALEDWILIGLRLGHPLPINLHAGIRRAQWEAI